MIVSVHIPKTAGTTFHALLVRRFGERVLHDMGDWPEDRSEAGLAHQAARRQQAIVARAQIEQGFDVIHGHFTAAKYQNLFEVESLITFVRDPYQRANSLFQHAVRKTDTGHHPLVKVVGHGKMSILEVIETIPHQQSIYLGGRPVSDFAMIGLTEQFGASIALLEALFGFSLDFTGERRNVNPLGDGAGYEISPELRRHVERYQADDVQLYCLAQERFARMARDAGALPGKIEGAV